KERHVLPLLRSLILSFNYGAISISLLRNRNWRTHFCCRPRLDCELLFSAACRKPFLSASCRRGAAGCLRSSDSSMILSHKYKLIFIKTAKTAGTSIEVFLSRQCGPQDIVTPIVPPVERHQPRNYEGFINPIPEILERPGKFFSAVRYTMTNCTKFYNHMPAHEVKQRVPADVWNGYFKFCVERNPWDKVLSHYHMHAAREGGLLSLDEYLARGRFPINYFRYTDRSGTKIIVDRILHYENLVAELSEVFSQ